jgi:hypothetical protein
VEAITPSGKDDLPIKIKNIIFHTFGANYQRVNRMKPG